MIASIMLLAFQLLSRTAATGGYCTIVQALCMQLYLEHLAIQAYSLLQQRHLVDISTYAHPVRSALWGRS